MLKGQYLWYLLCWRLLDGQLHHTWSRRGNHRWKGSARDGSLVAHSPAEKIKRKSVMRSTLLHLASCSPIVLAAASLHCDITSLHVIANTGSHHLLRSCLFTGLRRQFSLCPPLANVPSLRMLLPRFLT